jgi:hypothetical protein
MCARADSPSIELQKLTVSNQRIICDLFIPNQILAFSNERFAKALLRERPKLALHKCKNSNGDVLADTINHTSLAHIFEHIVIDLQVESAPQDSTFTFLGTTEWTSSDHTYAQVQCNFQDDIQAISACKDALSLLNKLVKECAHFR